MKTKELQLDKIRLDGGTQQRAKIDEQHVAELADAIVDGAQLPPAKVYHDGSSYWLARGFHRWHAHKKASLLTMPCEVVQGSLRDAVLDACGDNADHGLKRSNADKRKAVETLLADEEWGKSSDSWISEQCRVSTPFVAKVRSDLNIYISERTTKDGKAISTANRGRPPKSEARVTPAPVTPPSEDDCDWGDEETETAPRETVVDGVSWVETEEDQKATLSDDDWNEAEADIKAEKDRKNHARGYLKAAHKSLAALQENCLNASRLQAKIDLKVIDGHAKSLYSLVEKARTSL